MSERVGSDIQRRLVLEVDLEVQFQSRSMSDPPLYDIDFEDKMA